MINYIFIMFVIVFLPMQIKPLKTRVVSLCKAQMSELKGGGDLELKHLSCVKKF